jgi:hypothetical protein
LAPRFRGRWYFRIMLAAPAQIKWKDGAVRRVVGSDNTDRMELTGNE